MPISIMRKLTNALHIERNMANHTARIGRRRRVLNEEVLTAGTLPRQDLACVPGDTPRYGVGANIENHPQVTDLVPRRFRVIALILGVGISVGAVAELASYHSESLSKLLPAISAEEITTVFANRLVAWTSAATLLLVAGYTRLIFLLRRHRVDDIRGRYRIWKTAGWAAVALSLNTVVGGHTVVALVLGSFTGWSVLPGNAGFWLAAALLFGGGLLLRLIFDTTECRGAMSFYALASICFVAAGVNSAGWSPEWAAASPETLGRTLPLAGNLLLLVGSLLYARYITLDVQGLIEHAVVPESSEIDSTSIPQETATEAVPTEAETAVEILPVAAKISPDDSSWVDGSEMEPEDDSHNTRRLSKAEKKRLRKQKNRNRAA